MMGDQKSATPDIDTQIEERIKTFMDDNLHVVLEDEGDQSVIPTEQFAQDLAKAIKALLIQSKIDELDNRLPSLLNYSLNQEQLNLIHDRIKELKSTTKDHK